MEDTFLTLEEEADLAEAFKIFATNGTRIHEFHSDEMRAIF
ncbi:hypothetical protein IAD21_00875 [Abditibacteriota bacterium]|nr:hypothetical protein IAD21_00875 [Abditibacteriota bacterium]